MEKKTDESVKTGLQVEANSNTDNMPSAQPQEDALKETDADELIHQQTQDDAAVSTEEEQDIDEMVHSNHQKTMDNDNNNESDPDDLVHQK